MWLMMAQCLILVQIITSMRLLDIGFLYLTFLFSVFSNIYFLRYMWRKIHLIPIQWCGGSISNWRRSASLCSLGMFGPYQFSLQNKVGLVCINLIFRKNYGHPSLVIEMSRKEKLWKIRAMMLNEILLETVWQHEKMFLSDIKIIKKRLH